MRILFLAAIVILFQLCTYAVAKGLQWMVQPWASALMLKGVMIGLFIISNAFLLTILLGAFRYGMSYLVILWLALLSMVLTMLVAWVLGKVGIDAGHGIRVLALASFVGMLGLSYHNAYTPTVRHLSISLDKPMPTPVRLAMVSDLHLGSLFGAKQLDELAKILQAQSVDVLLIPGDVMDDNTVAYDKEGMAKSFAKVVKATKFGTVASLGNHDLYQVDAQSDIVRAISETGAVLLDDKTTTLDVTKDGNTTALSVLGRFDDHHTERMSTRDLMVGVDTSVPVILLDHRPSQIDDNSQLPIDIQVSGHTHNGQIFPANFIVKMLNRVGYGYEQIGNMHTIVSSGYGFWGVPLRLGSQSEVWVIDVKGRE